jgi:Tannase and feruloyl esterase
MYFGWADPQLNPLMGVEYYEQVVEKMGPSTGDFARLYMVPGMFHCGGGVGTGVFDTATPLVKWVEASAAPDRIEASRVVSGKVVRTRPLCPYPQIARYKGAGSIDDAANFSCAKP